MTAPVLTVESLTDDIEALADELKDRDRELAEQGKELGTMRAELKGTEDQLSEALTEAETLRGILADMRAATPGDTLHCLACRDADTALRLGL